MRKKIGRKIYDTEKSKLLGHHIEGSFGDPEGFEEFFYRKGKEDYFLHARGGEASPYAEEVIQPLELADAHAWMTRVLGEAEAKSIIAQDAPKAKKNKRQATKKSKAKDENK